MSRTLLLSLLLCSPSVVVASSGCSDAQCSPDPDASAMLQMAMIHDSDDDPKVKLNVPDVEVNVNVKNNSKSATAAQKEQHMNIHIHDTSLDVTHPNGTVVHYNLTHMLHAYWGQQATYGERLLFAIKSWALYVALALMVWYFVYPAAPVPLTDSADIEEPIETFNNGHFQCFKDSGICICALCCPGLRWADTMSLVGFLKISTGLTAVFACGFLNSFFLATAVAGPFTIGLALYYRHMLREKFAVDAWTTKTCLIDCVYIMFCPWCALAQEARVVTHAAQKGQLESQEVS